jgi:hypothetical protein
MHVVGVETGSHESSCLTFVSLIMFREEVEAETEQKEEDSRNAGTKMTTHRLIDQFPPQIMTQENFAAPPNKPRNSASSSLIT